MCLDAVPFEEAVQEIRHCQGVAVIAHLKNMVGPKIDPRYLANLRD